MMNLASNYFSLNRKFLVFNLISRNLKIRYRKSWLGMLWTVLIPALSSAVYFFIFRYFLKVQVENYFLLITVGIIPWAFFVSSISSSTEIIVLNHNLLNKCPLPVQSLVLAEVLTYFLNLIASIPVIVVITLFSGMSIGIGFIQFLILLVLFLGIVYGLAIVFSFSYVYFRDLKHLVGLSLQLWFYLTPIMYETKMIPEKFISLLYLNPIGVLFDSFHRVLVGGEWLSLSQWAVVLAWTLGLNLVGMVFVRKYGNTLVEVI